MAIYEPGILHDFTKEPDPPDVFLTSRRYQFRSFYYPFSDLLIQELNKYGVDGILRPDGSSEAQQALYKQYGFPDDNAFSFQQTYDPNNDIVLEPHPKERFDFSFGGAFSDYNWEIFFHAPLITAVKLSQNQKFEDAQKWFHYIFDPTISFDPNLTTGTQEEIDREKQSRFWRLKPFYEYSKESNIAKLLAELSGDIDNPAVQNLEAEIDVWEKNPFKPHLISKIRVFSYMKYTIMMYLDNLITWGDHLFRQDTMESINEATQHYLLASTILGERPSGISRKSTPDKSYDDLYGSSSSFDELSNALIELENGVTGSPVRRGSSNAASGNGLNSINVLFFCIPSNKKMEGYWDLVADRLFKIRNCQNIDGVERQLALFAPPIDPLALVKAAAGGGSYLDAIRNLNQPLPNYRFTYMIQRAIELCNDVKTLGNAFLSALEKKDAEIISNLRNKHEIEVLDNLRYSKKLAIEESNEAIEALVQSKDSISHRLNYYASREYMNAQEKQQLAKLKSAIDIEIPLAKTEALIGTLEAIPGISFGTNGAMASPHFATRFSPRQASAAIMSSLRIIRTTAQKERYYANRASIKAGFDRRKDDWKFQQELAKIELKQVDKQIKGAYIRRDIALYEKELNEKQLKNAEEIAEVMETKYTNKELYSWMVSKLSSTYFDSYQLALNVAKVAERCYQFETNDNSTFIENDNWNSLKKGLLAGDHLLLNIRNLQREYDKKNGRRLELKKNVSLAMLSPESLIELRESGTCTFQIPELLFDLDFPGHYNRRVKSVSISIPCVLGPNGNVPAKLILTQNLVRPQIDHSYSVEEDSYVIGRGGTHSIATSTANRDSGMFELNFNDQRYLPFEGAGVISTWTLKLPPVNISQFDYDTISDVILHIDYEAEEGGNSDSVVTYLENNMQEVAEGTDWSNVISLKEQFHDNYIQFLNPEPSTDAIANMNIQSNHFPFVFRNKDIVTTEIEVIIFLKDSSTISAAPSGDIKLSDNTNETTLAFSFDNDSKKLTAITTANEWNLSQLSLSSDSSNNNELDNLNVEDILLLIKFNSNTPS